MCSEFEIDWSSIIYYFGQTDGRLDGPPEGKDIKVLAQTYLVEAWTKSELGNI